MYISMSPPPGQHGSPRALLPPPPPLPQGVGQSRDEGEVGRSVGQSVPTWSPSPSVECEGEHCAGGTPAEGERILRQENIQVVSCVVSVICGHTHSLGCSVGPGMLMENLLHLRWTSSCESSKVKLTMVPA